MRSYDVPGCTEAEPETHTPATKMAGRQGRRVGHPTASCCSSGGVNPPLHDQDGSRDPRAKTVCGNRLVHLHFRFFHRITAATFSAVIPFLMSPITSL